MRALTGRSSQRSWSSCRRSRASRATRSCRRASTHRSFASTAPSRLRSVPRSLIRSKPCSTATNGSGWATTLPRRTQWPSSAPSMRARCSAPYLPRSLPSRGSFAPWACASPSRAPTMSDPWQPWPSNMAPPPSRPTASSSRSRWCSASPTTPRPPSHSPCFALTRLASCAPRPTWSSTTRRGCPRGPSTLTTFASCTPRSRSTWEGSWECARCAGSSSSRTRTSSTWGCRTQRPSARVSR
mmetsp:Transcript_35431/g.90498  ORF Transcript_35431/g.90498 Transcript_35431/m.90498 type:complete len:241 (+) Transcript_35431:366-1088(+)